MTKREIKAVLRIATGYIGAVVGAAFASGQEILQFFVLFGPQGKAGIALATFLFCFFGVAILECGRRYQIASYRDLLTPFLGQRLIVIVDVIMALALLAGLGIMLAAGGALLKQQFDWPATAGSALLAVVVILVLLRGREGFLQANALLVPIKIISVILLFFLLLGKYPFFSSAGGTKGVPLVAGHWALSAFLYVSYNMVLTAAVLGTLYDRQVKVNVLGGMLGGVGLGLLAACIGSLLYHFYPQAASCQIPMVKLAGLAGPLVQKGYALVVMVAIFTAALANAYGFACRIAQKFCVSWRVAGIAAVVAVLPMLSFSFAKLVVTVYPFFGYIGLFYVILLPAAVLRRS
ncbi:MAG: hypothetical protein PWQ91_654 [Eubacteriales bacterium]|nr:hypothetical protein [Eubacteriales bacterium]MDN5363593.1 hypothetical protein [Eubacteriales bacterium]